ncbi:hypothetical protein LR48_Vigan01g304500 [Vigna angularis]|uniref:Protein DETOXIFICATION n=1 Tax=Phaseolus angularis TaxID=3914 RepID=A0A0L9TTL3_PHAAN|nr:hypothetical protein LR48_Vigan01g304500 [Vigna angularis]
MSLVGYLKNLTLVVCMGRLGSLELAGGSLAIGFSNITGYSVLSGLAMGMEPLCTQAFGPRNFSLLSLTLHRTIHMLLLFSLPISLLWLNLQPLMLFLRQNPDITHVATLYCRFAIPDLIPPSSHLSTQQRNNLATAVVHFTFHFSTPLHHHLSNHQTPPWLAGNRCFILCCQFQKPFLPSSVHVLYTRSRGILTVGQLD